MPGPNTKRYEKEREKYAKEVKAFLKESNVDVDEDLVKEIKKSLSFKQVQYKIYEIFNYPQMKRVAELISQRSEISKTSVMRALLLPLFKETTSELDDDEITLISYLSSREMGYVAPMDRIKEDTMDGEYKVDDLVYALTGLTMKGIFTNFKGIYSLVEFKKIGRK